MTSQLSVTIIGALILILALSVIGSAQNDHTNLKYGKYGCNSSIYRNGFYEYTPRGSFVITKDGNYTYTGFKKPSKGKFRIDQKGNLIFKDGYLNGGKAEKTDRPNKFFLIFPANPDSRWTCGCTDK